MKRLSRLDPRSAHHVGRDHVVDAQHVFYGSLEVMGADPATFRIGPTGPEDRNRCYRDVHPTACDWATRFDDHYPDLPLPVSSDSAVVTGLGLIRDSGLPGDMWYGYHVVPATTRAVPLECFFAGREPPREPGVFEPVRPGHFYKLFQNQASKTCSAAADASVALVVGRTSGPAAWLLDASGKAHMQREVPRGHQTISVLCRETTRTAAIERKAELKLNVVAGEIYRLEADFHAPDYVCTPRAMALSANKGTP